MIRILVVDDHELVRRGTRQLLHEAFPGAEVAEAPRPGSPCRSG